MTQIQDLKHQAKNGTGSKSLQKQNEQHYEL
jgi:hypothetical protein